MANVYVTNIEVNRRSRNKRPYSGYFSYSNTNVNNNTGIAKTIIEFVNEDFPEVLLYDTDYAQDYGQYPTIALFTIDGDGNRVERSEKPYFVMNVDNKIESVNFGTLADGEQTGFISIGR